MSRTGILCVVSGPSGSGKTTLCRGLSRLEPDQCRYAVSATTRLPRSGEEDGRDYHFLDEDTFRKRVAAGEFVEWARVHGNLYGTLKSEVERLWAEGKHIIFDIDVKGAMNIKKEYPREALAVFVKPPSMEALEKRLKARRTEDEHTLKKRLARASEEMAYENKFDRVLVNDVLKEALATAEQIVESFIKQS